MLNKEQTILRMKQESSLSPDYKGPLSMKANIPMAYYTTVDTELPYLSTSLTLTTTGKLWLLSPPLYR